ADMMFDSWFETWGQEASGGLLLRGACALDHAHDVRFLHDQQVLAVDFDFGAGPALPGHCVIVGASATSKRRRRPCGSTGNCCARPRLRTRGLRGQGAAISGLIQPLLSST